MSDSATLVSLRRAAVFAAGHIGELTWQIPLELVDAVLADTHTTERRLRALPSRVGVYFVLACCLFPGLGLSQAVGQADRRPTRPDIAVGQGLSRSDVAAWALPRCGRCSRCWPARWHSRAPRACGSAATAPSPSTAACRSRWPTPTATGPGWASSSAALGITGYPVIRLMTVVETGTRAMLGAVFGPPSVGEIDYARRLLGLLDTDMLVLGDRGFDAEAFLTDLAGTGAQFLVRLRLDPPTAGARTPRRRLHTCRASARSRCGSSPPTSPSPAPTAPATPPTTGWPPPCATRAAIPPTGSSPCITNAGNTRSPTWRCATPWPRAVCCARPTRPVRTGNVGAARRLPGAAPAMVTAVEIPSRHRPGPRQLHHRPPNRQRPPGHRRQRHRRHRPPRPHRHRGPRRAAPTATVPHQRPKGQIPAVALQQERPLPARTQHTDHRPDHDHHRPRTETRDTRTEVVDNSPRTLTTGHCGLS